MADVKGGRIHYEVYGQGPPLVFLHSGIADGRMWDEQVKYFSRRYTVVRYDARGYGQSEVPSQPYGPVEDLHDLLEFLKIGRASIVGASMGGTIAIDYALAFPQAVSALIVVGGSPGWLSYSSALVNRTGASAAAGREHGPERLADAWLADPMLTVARTRPRIAAQVRTYLIQNAGGILRLTLMRPPNIPQPSLSGIQSPTLVMVGALDDPEIVERARLMAREIPGAVLRIVGNADHMANLENPREFNRLVDSLLRSLR